MASGYSGCRHGVLPKKFDIIVKDAMPLTSGAEVVVEQFETSRGNWDLKWQKCSNYYEVQWPVPRDYQDRRMKSQLMKLLKDIKQKGLESVAFNVYNHGRWTVQMFAPILWEAVREADFDIKIILCTIKTRIQEIHDILKSLEYRTLNSEKYSTNKSVLPMKYSTYELLQCFENDTLKRVTDQGCSYVYGKGNFEIVGSKADECEAFIKKAFMELNKLESDNINTSSLDQQSLRATIDKINKKRKVFCSFEDKDSVAIYGRTSTSVTDARKELEKCQTQKRQRKEGIFFTKENIKILVYVGDILDLNVDCIVNAADPSLIHSAGISKKIAEAAGKELTKDCDEHTRKNRYKGLAVGKVFKSRAGKLKYKCVVHAVGPCWEDFSPYTEESVTTCETLLRATIQESMVCAKSDSNVRSIAFPAVSSGKFRRVPRELCCVQYAKALIEYSKNTPYPLEEIHFVDTNSDMIHMIAETFDSMINQGRTPGSYNRSIYIKQSHTDISGKGATASPCTPGYSSKPTTSRSPIAIPNSSMTDFTLGQSQNLHIYTGDILKVPKVDLIVCGDVLKGKSTGYLAKKLWDTCGEKYRKNKIEAFKGKSDGNVVFCQSEKYRWVAHALLIPRNNFPTEKERQDKVNSMFRAIFDGMKSHSCRTMALPLIGTGKASGDPGFYAERFIESLMHFCSFQKMFVFEIHLVNLDSNKTSKAIEVIKTKIDKASKPIRKHPQKHSSMRSTTTNGDFPNYKRANVSCRNKAHDGNKQHSKRPSSAVGISGTSDYGMFDNKSVRGKANPDFSQSQRHYRPNSSYGYNSSEDESSSPKVVRKELEKISVSVKNTSSTVTACSPSDSATSATSLLKKSCSSAKDTDVGQKAGNLKIFYCNTLAKPGVSKDKAETSFKDDYGAGLDDGGVDSCDDNDDQDDHDYIHSYDNDNGSKNTSDSELEEMEVDKDDDEDGCQLVDDTPEDCVICMDTMDKSTSKALPCGHRFCADCVDQQFVYKEACPTCGYVCGVITGDQPEGDMDIKMNDRQSCAGYEEYGRIEITYQFQNGRQNANHPDPGKPYKGIRRTAYLPYNKQGKTILEMLKVAFDRKLTFTIGRSRTTGADSVITWNDIHHKTDPKPCSQFGYPDPTYLDRVTDELKAKGVTVDDIPQLSRGGRKR